MTKSQSQPRVIRPTLDITGATETHCQPNGGEYGAVAGCAYAQYNEFSDEYYCACYNKTQEFDSETRSYKRIAQCLADEKGAGDE